MSTQQESTCSVRRLAAFAVAVGILAVPLQLLSGGELAALLSVVVLGGTVAGINGLEMRTLARIYQGAFEALFLCVLVGYAIVVAARWLPVAQSLVSQINDQWPGLLMAIMCIFVGIAALRAIPSRESGQATA